MHSGPPRTTPKSGFCGQCGGWSARHPRMGWTRGRGRGISGMNHLPPPRFLHLGCRLGNGRSDWPLERPGFIKLRVCRGRCGLAYCVTKSLHVHSRFRCCLCPAQDSSMLPTPPCWVASTALPDGRSWIRHQSGIGYVLDHICSGFTTYSIKSWLGSLR